MKICRWQCYIVINCVILFPYLFAKPVSLNEIIKAESKKNQTLYKAPNSKKSDSITKPVSLNDIIKAESSKKPILYKVPDSKKSESRPERFSLNKGIFPTSWIKSKLLKSKVKELPGLLNIHPFKYKKIFHIKSPLHPKKLKYKQRNKRKDHSFKQKINDDSNNEKYIPLLRNLGMLFDTLIESDTSDSIEIKSEKYEPHKSDTDNGRKMVCTCRLKSNSDEELLPQETAIVTPQIVTTEIARVTKTPAKTTVNTPVGNICTVGQNKNISLLLSRDSSSGRGDDNGYSERGSSTFHRSTERNISRDNGDREYNARVRENESNTKSNEENTNRTPRDDASSHGFGRRDGNNARNGGTETNEDYELEKDENAIDINRVADEFQKYDKHEEGNETESSKSLSEYDRGLRGLTAEDIVSDNPGPLQSEKNNEKSKYHVTHNHTSYKRVPDRDGPTATDVQEVYTEHETVISIKDLSNLTLALQSAPKGNIPVVTIYDGYSVARDINGQNRLSEQSILIHSNT
ncbi:LOW QUALITY PROTEIN: uncharacterized protein ACR2FA_011688 [Aphomia sociella]